jgi:hypothetical protein
MPLLPVGHWQLDSELQVEAGGDSRAGESHARAATENRRPGLLSRDSDRDVPACRSGPASSVHFSLVTGPGTCDRCCRSASGAAVPGAGIISVKAFKLAVSTFIFSHCPAAELGRCRVQSLGQLELASRNFVRYLASDTWASTRKSQ